MKILGIIAEYNPFHNGHLYHIEKSKEITGADAVIAVMSGNFVQRGEPAIIDKWARAEMAVRNGVDVVFELPFAYAVNSADHFARGGVRLLDGLGCVDYLSFGSESGDLEVLKVVADAFGEDIDELRAALRRGLDTGLPYPVARAHAIIKRSGISMDTLSNPNNILAIEYLRSLTITGSEIEPVTIKREGQGYNDDSFDESGDITNGIYPSASAIRRAIHGNVEISTLSSSLSNETIDILKRIDNDVKPVLNDFFGNISYEILKSDAKELSQVYAVTEGLENRMKSAVRTASDIDSLVEEVLSKRYTRARIRRILVQTLVGLRRDDIELFEREGAMYGRILAFSEKGAEVIKSIKKSDKCSIPIITNINKDRVEGEALNKLLSYDLKASDIYNLATGRSIYDYSDNVRTPYFKK